MKCENCKYFGDEIVLDEWSSDNTEETPTGFHQCKIIEHAGMDGSDLIGLQDLAVVVDGSGYMGAIRVKSDFGCVNFNSEIERLEDAK